MQGAQLPGEIRPAEDLRPLESRPGRLTSLAIQYVLAEPRISTVIPGARSIEQARANVDADLTPGLTREEAEIIRDCQMEWKTARKKNS